MLTSGVIFAIAAGIALTLYIVRQAGPFAGWCLLVAGFGVTGLLGSLRDVIGGWLSGVGVTVGQILFGASAAIVIAVMIGVYLYFKLIKKSGKFGILAGVMAFVFPVLLIAAGFGGLIHGVSSTVAPIGHSIVQSVHKG